MANSPRPRLVSAFAALAVAALVLTGCATDPADVEDRSIGESPSLQAPPPVPVKAVPPGGSYRVAQGDTLYSLSFKRGLDYRDVAAWNGIAAPDYKIRVGQVIRFAPSGMPSQATSPAPIAPSEKVAGSTAAATPSVSAPPPSAPANNGDNMFEDVPNTPASARIVADDSVPDRTPAPLPAPVPARSVAAAQPSSPPAAVVPASPPAPAQAQGKPVAEPASPAQKPVNESATANAGGISWRWPNGGKVIGTYVAGDQTKQGVDIAGNAGDPVLASADGEVVYSGNGLLGYGELIIVKHNASFLSAYGHNRKRLVAEGDKVRAGQQIAEMGSSASSRDELHFEIRKSGKPVNPLDYLPSR